MHQNVDAVNTGGHTYLSVFFHPKRRHAEQEQWPEPASRAGSVLAAGGAAGGATRATSEPGFPQSASRARALPSAAPAPVGLGSAATPVGGAARCSPGHVTGANMAAPIGVHLFVRGGKRSAYDRSRAPRPEIKPRVDAARTCVLSVRPLHTIHTGTLQKHRHTFVHSFPGPCRWVLEICGSSPKVFLPHFTCVISVTDIYTGDACEMRFCIVMSSLWGTCKMWLLSWWLKRTYDTQVIPNRCDCGESLLS